jgi:hypothetical protein
MKSENIINKKITITDKDSIYYQDWAIVKHFDGESFHVAIANDENMLVIFDRDQFKVDKNQMSHK